MRRAIAIISTEEIANHRGRLIQDMAAAGYRVLAFAPYREDLEVAIAKLGGEYHQIHMGRASLNPFTTERDIRLLARQLREEAVESVFTAGTKPNLIGTLAAARARISARYAMIAGLGYAFAPGTEIRRRFARTVMSHLMRSVYRRCRVVFVQNEDDLRFVREKKWVRLDQQTIRTYGSGVDLDNFRASPAPTGPLRFLLTSRLLREKGVLDFVAAARVVRSQHPDVCFQLLGRFDINPGSIGRSQVEAWHNEGIVEYLGATLDVRPYLRDCSVFVLPSYYREGVPRTILEAMAVGRAIITTDTPGCRDTVVDRHNGYLIPPRDPDALVGVIEHLIANPSLVFSMGKESRRLAEQRFDVHSVNAKIMETMGV